MKNEKRGETHIFDKDISLVQKDEFSFKGNIAENWSINGNPNGGYLMALGLEETEA